LVASFHLAVGVLNNAARKAKMWGYGNLDEAYSLAWCSGVLSKRCGRVVGSKVEREAIQTVVAGIGFKGNDVLRAGSVKRAIA